VFVYNHEDLLTGQGDPYSDSVILWTRIAPSVESDTSNITVEGTVPFYSHETEQYIKTSSNPICLDWTVSTDKASSAVVSKGQAYTTSDIDYTVKVSSANSLPVPGHSQHAG
jgi:alkaline phosphatase D